MTILKRPLLLVEDEPGIRFSIRRFFEAKGYEVWDAESASEGERVFRASRPDITLLDYSLPDGNGLELLQRLRALDPTVPVLILTAHGTIDLAVRAIKEGAEQFLTKPIDLGALLVVVERALDRQRNEKVHQADRSRHIRDSPDPFLGESPAIRRLEQEARRVLISGSPILIQGETGSGKGVLARWLHENGPRAAQAFVDLNCAGLSREFLDSELFGHEKGAFTGATASKPGLLETAHRGTLFLDEIGDMELGVQPKLLKVLEEQKFRRLGSVRDQQVDVRLIAASHHDLSRRAQDRLFREDLYFRISALRLVVPPLRERRGDIARIASSLLHRTGTDLDRVGAELAPDAVAALEAHDWPGNVRELRNVLERALLRSEAGILRAGDLAEDLRPARQRRTTRTTLTLDEAEKLHIQEVLDKHGRSVAEAAVSLGISRSALYQKLKRHQILLS